MAFQKGPAVRLSDIDDLMRENALDSSDGQALINYIRRKQGAPRPRLNLLFDGAEKPINFRFDHLQPIPQAAQQKTAASAETISDPTDSPASALASSGPSATLASEIALVQPHSINSRVASFVTPIKATPPLSPRNRLCIPENSTAHRMLSPSKIPVQRSGSSANLNRLTLIKECQRANQLKCELLRKITSSTPNAGEKTQRGSDFMSSKESVSPIYDERSPDGRLAADAKQADAVPSRLDRTVPATQDQADRNARETTPPPPVADGGLVVIPETPSPVRRSSSRPATPFSALRSYRSSTPKSILSTVAAAPPNGSANCTPQRSILKKRNTSVVTTEQMVVSPLPRHRVSFCEQRNEVRKLSPAYARSPRLPDVTSDESSEEEEEEIDAAPLRIRERKTEAIDAHNRKSNIAETVRTVHLRSSPLTRSDAVDRPVESPQPVRTDGITATQWEQVQLQMVEIHATPKSPQDPSRNLRRSRLSFDDMIRNGAVEQGMDLQTDGPSRRSSVESVSREDDFNDREGPRHEKQSAVGGDGGVSTPVANRKSTHGAQHKAKNKTNGNMIDMLMDDCDGGDSGDSGGSNDRSPASPAARTAHSRTITTPEAITNIDTPRTVLMDIFEPPSAFCDGSSMCADSLPMEVNHPDGDQEVETNSRRHDRADVIEQLQQSEPRKRRSVPSGPEATAEADVQENFNTKTQADAVPQRMKSISSPMDHVSAKMIDAVDKIHSQVYPEDNNDMEENRRTTILLPKRRRRAKSNVDGDTESYFKAVEQMCDPRKEPSKTTGGGRERRKLFARELSLPASIDGENIPSPEPLPATQDEETCQSQQLHVEVEKEGELNKRPEVVAVVQPETRTLGVVVNRLTRQCIERLELRIANLRNDDGPQRHDPREESSTGSASESPIAEKQNSEATEKKAGRASAKTVATNNDGGASDAAQRTKHQKKKKKRKEEQKTSSASSDRDYGQKYWKDVSNELRQQVEGEGLRRSNRNRCISAHALWCNPGVDKHDAPKYKMPSPAEILRLYMASEAGQRKGAKKAKPVKAKASKTATKKPPQAAAAAAVATVDKDGFCVPVAPVSKRAEIRCVDVATLVGQVNETGNHHSSTNAVSHDSGISSAVMTNDEVTETMPAPKRQQEQHHQPPSGSGTATTNPPEAAATCDASQGDSTEDVVSAKRQAMDWMMMLMENSKDGRAGASLMTVTDIHGFTHSSIDHLTFQRRGKIEYSFYIYSKTDNFGFVRFLPNAVKKMARVSNCSLKFLIMRGSLTFVINGHEVKAVGGDFLMLSTGSSYKITNSSEVSLLFMIKTIIREGD